MKNPALSLRKAHHPVPVRAGINSAVTIGSVCGEIKRGYLALGGIRPPGAGETQPLTLDMKKELITQLHERFESCAREKDGVSFWLARELQELLGYTQWRNFEIVVTKAKTACSNAGQRPEDHFAEVSKMIDLAKGAQREVTDIALSQYRQQPQITRVETGARRLDEDPHASIQSSVDRRRAFGYASCA